MDDGIDTWPESIRAGTAALGLYLRCGAWISREIGGGRIAEAVVPVEVAAMYGSKEWVARLLDVGFWEHVADGYADRRYHSMGNPTAEKAARQKAAKAERQRRWLEKARAEETRRRQSKDASHDGSRDIAPSLPPLKGKGTRARSAGRSARPVASALSEPDCPRHQGWPAGNCGGCRSEQIGAA